MNLSKLRNIGVSAHIDSGKTTLSERMLYYTGKIHRMEEVHGGGGATMDHMEQEKARGITITSAATTIEWDDHHINLIDTPGHIDFTVEVERSLRVLDGAVLVLCAVGGVQPQSLTVDRQMKRNHVPRIAFINKMDRTGADPIDVCQQMRDKLDTDAVLMQLPIGAGDTFEAVIDLVTMKALYFDGGDEDDVREAEIPAEHQEDAATWRNTMLEALSMYSDEMMELLLSEESIPQELIYSVTKSACQQQGLTPVFLGAAYKNKGVQPLLDAVVRFLPSPLEREISAKDWEDPDKKIELKPDPAAGFVGMAFKIVDNPYGQLTFTRIYQGTVQKGQLYYNQRTGKKERFSRILRIHAGKHEELDEASAGDIVAIMGIDGASGETYCSQPKTCTLESIYVPEPVIKIAISPQVRSDADKLGKALQRFRREDPTFHVLTDDETGETLIAGMGELQLDVYLTRLKSDYDVTVDVGAPRVSYREAPTKSAEFNYKHKKQTGGSGQYAHMVGKLECLPEDAEELFEFEENIVGGRIPKQYIPSIEKGMRDCLPKGPLAEFPVVRIKAIIDDGSYHDVDSSDRAFQIAARDCFRETFPKTAPVLLEPIMKVDIEAPEQFQGAIVGDVTTRRGIITATETCEGDAQISAEVPLGEMFGYSTDLRSMTQGQGDFTMELFCYRRVPASLQEDIIAEKKKQLVGAK